jgi:hypothetical protein
MYVQGSLHPIHIPNTLELNRPQHERPAACVIAQQYSSATFVSLRTHSRKKKNSAYIFKMFLFHFNFLKLYDYEIA